MCQLTLHKFVFKLKYNISLVEKQVGGGGKPVSGNWQQLNRLNCAWFRKYLNPRAPVRRILLKAG